MTRIDFHIIPAVQTADRLAYAARLVAKARSRQHTVMLAVDDADQAQQLSDVLWGLTPDSFLPHGLLDGEPDAVQIGWHDHPGTHHDVLINLASNLPDYFSRFERVFEVVSQEPAILEHSRQRYRFYQDRGYPLTRHDLRDRA
ncbi:hypothetical protein BGP77_06555 [Saccharospirillum sp. MSK14-1]|uniref:DNA polymerase III subunit chi n=1 Tax=Saccharospirillum sp. MSK14-1 TaxID=1897632 RepID=UPI000D3B1E04|nr:DNA polymerase III subunit chi [Saccharospirillum sp. MSK14-1]PTY36941.1 hypothetical protein BGP77_06555 [Saccharospirillum sp. MSK14-1]